MLVMQPKIKPLTPIDGKQMLMNIQRIAKTSYKAYRDKDDFESAKRITKKLLETGHLSMLEFETITMNYESNIAAYKDLRTHRLSTFCVESTRNINYSKDKFGGGLSFIDPVEIEKDTPEYKIWLDTMKLIEKNYLELAKLGAKPDQLSLILPHSTKAEFNISANLREWRHILSLRSSIASTGHARPCIAQIMDPTLELFHKEIPVVFDDLYAQYKEKTR